METFKDKNTGGIDYLLMSRWFETNNREIMTNFVVEEGNRAGEVVCSSFGSATFACNREAVLFVNVQNGEVTAKNNDREIKQE